MAKRISREEIAPSEALQGVRDFKHAAEENIVAFSQLDTVAKNLAKTLKTAFTTDPKGIREAFQDQQKLNIAYQRSIELDKVSGLTLKQRQSAEQSLQRQRERSIKQMDREAQKAAELNRPYNLLSKRLNDLRKDYKDLAVSGQENTKSARDMRVEIMKLDNQLKGVDGSVGQFQRNVGNYTKSLSVGFKSVLGFASQLGLAFSGGALIRSSIDTLTQFSEKNADIAKTTGLSTEAAGKLSQELQKIDTRSSVTELQELASAAGRLNIEGSENIQGFVRSADKAFVALGDDLDGTAEEIATNIGKIAGVYGDEKEFGIEKSILKVGSSINELAGKSKAAAAPILDFQQRLAGLGNLISSSDSAALGAFFDEGGQSIEVASSTLNTLLPKLASNYKEFAKTAGMTAEEFKSLAERSPIEALKSVALGARNSEKGLFNLSKTVQSFGVDSARATSIVGFLSNNTERLTELQQISNEAYVKGTSLTDEFEKKNQTLSARIAKLGNAWDAYVISADSAYGATGSIGNLLDYLTNNLPGIISLIGKVAIAFVTWKAVMISMKLVDRVREMRDLKKSVGDVSKEAGNAGKSLDGFGTALKGMGIALAIDLLIDLGLQFYNVASGAYQAEQAINKMGASISKAENQAKGRVNSRSVELNKQIVALEKKAAQDRKKDGADVAKINAQLIKDKEALTAATKKLSQADYNAVKSRREELRKELEQEIENDKILRKALGDTIYAQQRVQGQTNMSTLGFGSTAVSSGLDRIATLRSQIGAVNAKMSIYQDELNGAKDATNGLASSQEDLGKGIDENTKKTKQNTTALKDNNDELQRVIDLANDELSLRRQIADLREDEITKPFVPAQENEIILQKEIIDSGKMFNVDDLEQMISQEYELRRKYATEQARFDKKAVQSRYNDERIIAEKALLDKRDELLTQDNLTAIEREKIQQSYEDQLAELDRKFLERKRIVALEQEKIELELKKRLGEITQQENDRINEVNDELNDYKISADEKANEKIRDNAEKLAEEKIKADEEEKKRLQDMADFRNEILEKGTKFLTDQIDRQIQQQDRISEKAKSTQDYLTQLASEGNINAQQSIVEQQRIQEEADRKKIELERRKATILATSAVIQSFNQKVAQGDKTPAISTIAEAETIFGFLATLPKFYQGTEKVSDSLSGNKVHGGRDGYLLMADGSERIMDGANNAKTSGMSNDLVADVAYKYRTGELVERGNDVTGNTFDISELIRASRAIESAILDRNEGDILYRKISDTMGMIVSNDKRRNLTTTNKYIIRK